MASAEPHRCRDCDRCDCRSCNVPCGWDCGCPDYPPPETRDGGVSLG